jgi:dolichol-phosphate mannosyltransferase
MERARLSEWVQAGVSGLFSVVIPAYNEEGDLADTVGQLVASFDAAGINYEILVVNDNSTDATEQVLQKLCSNFAAVRYINNEPPHGFGCAVRAGLESFHGDAVAIVMADGSDPPDEVVGFAKKLREGYDCVYGSRFSQGAKLIDYPLPKLLLNRLGNTIIRLLFGLRYNDITNAFKCYRREVIAGVQPIISNHFNLTVELPLKAIVRGYSYAVVPNSWRNRTMGISKFKIREMGSRYLFIILYCWIEKRLSRGDYHRSKNEFRLGVGQPPDQRPVAERSGTRQALG